MEEQRAERIQISPARRRGLASTAQSLAMHSKGRTERRDQGDVHAPSWRHLRDSDVSPEAGFQRSDVVGPFSAFPRAVRLPEVEERVAAADRVCREAWKGK